MTPKIYLQPASVARVCHICDTVRSRSPKNRVTVEMCKGIKEWVEHLGFVSHKQAKWIIQNATFHRMRLPAELEQFAAEREIDQSAKRQAPIDPPERQELIEMLARLARIEALLTGKKE